MEICKYCNSMMIGESETKINESYDFFYVCSKCESIYEGTKDKNNITLKSRWFNKNSKQFEDEFNY